MYKEILEHFKIFQGDEYYVSVNNFFNEDDIDNGDLDEFFWSKRFPKDAVFISFRVLEGPVWFGESLLTLIDYENIKFRTDTLREIKNIALESRLKELVEKKSNFLYIDIEGCSLEDNLASIIFDCSNMTRLPSEIEDWSLKSREGMTVIRKMKRPEDD